MFIPIHEKMRRETNEKGLLQITYDEPYGVLERLKKLTPLLHFSDETKLETLQDLQNSIVKYESYNLFTTLFKKTQN